MRADNTAVPDHKRRDQFGRGVDARIFPHPNTGNTGADIHLLLQHVKLRLHILLYVADIAPVAIGHEGIKGLTGGKQAREKVLRKVNHLIFIDVLQDLRF